MSQSPPHLRPAQAQADLARVLDVLRGRLSDEIHRSAIFEAGLAEALVTRNEQARLLADGARLVRELPKAYASLERGAATDATADAWEKVGAIVARLSEWHQSVTGQAPRADIPAE